MNMRVHINFRYYIYRKNERSKAEFHVHFFLESSKSETLKQNNLTEN